MDPMAMPEDMADAMDSDADADSSGQFSGSGCAPEPVPTQYEAFENVGLNLCKPVCRHTCFLYIMLLQVLNVTLLPWWVALSYTMC